MPPAETLGRALPFMPAMGITRIGNVTGLDRIGLPVVMVCRPNSRSLSVAQGKGLDLLAAKASGLMESIEGYHAEHIARPLLHESYQALVRQHRLVDVDKLPRTADSAFDPETPLYWIEGYDILQDEPAWVPYELVHLDYRVHSLRGARSFIPSSNGLASGNHLLEAVSHGICEVVEHDAEVLWSLGGTDSRGRTRIDLSTIHDPTHRWVLDRCAQADVAVYVWEITSDIGIPAFVCVMVDESGRGSGRCGAVSGMGCHPARQLALSRALTEAAQSRLTMISGSRDDKHPHVYEETTRPESLERVRRLVEVSGPLRGFAGPTWEGDTVADDVLWELERLRAAGIEEVVVVNLSKPEFGLPVVRVIVPGLEFHGERSNYRYGARARSQFLREVQAAVGSQQANGAR